MDTVEGLIREHEQLKDEYAALLREFAAPVPDPLLAMSMGRGGSKSLPTKAQQAYDAKAVERSALLSVRLPFHKANWRDSKVHAAHEQANAWRDRLWVVLRRLRRCCRLELVGRGVADFPLLRVMGTDSPMGGKDVLDAFDQHLEVLRFEEQKAAKPERCPASISLGSRLRAVRRQKDHGLKKVAAIVGRSPTTISRIESGERQPNPGLRTKIEEYIADE